MAMHPSDIRAVLSDAAPVVGSYFGAIGNLSGNYIADRILPPIAGAEGASFAGNLARLRADALFGDVDADDAFNIESDPNDHGGAALELVSYRVRGYGLRHMFDTRKLMNLPLMGDAERIASIEAQYKPTYETLRIRREARAAALYGTPAVWSTTGAAGALWSIAGTDIIGDINTLCEGVRTQSGMDPNAFISSRSVLSTLRTAPQLLNFLPTNIDRNFMSSESVVEFLKMHFSFDLVEFGRARANTVSTGVFTGVDLFTDWVWVGYLPTDGSGVIQSPGTMTGPADAIVTPSATALIQTKPFDLQYVEDSANPYKVGYLGDYMEDMVRVQPELGALLTGVV